jgi:subtilisin family serine protease
MLDTGLGASPALAGAAIVRNRFLPESAAPSPSEHGTAVATLIAGADAAAGFEGAARGATVFAGEVMRAAPNGAHAAARSLLPALDWLLAERVQVANLSFGGPANRLLADALDTALGRAVVVVAAAGNGGPGAPPAYPAAHRGVIAVTANDARGEVYVRANRGAYVTLSAPGVDVWIPDADGGRYVTGTSFAAAWVTGAAARLLAEAPALGPAQVAARLCSSARDLGAPGRDPVFGCGLLQVQPALLYAGSR